MIFILISLNLLDIGYNKKHIPKNEIYDIQQENFSFVFQSDSPLLVKLYSDKLNQSYKLKSLQYIQVKSHHIQFLSKKENSILQFWKIPNTLCNLRSMILLNDYQTKFSSSTESVENDFCLFSQFDFIAYYTHLRFHSSSPDCTLNYYTSAQFEDLEPSFVCKSDEECNFNIFSPFFISFDKCAKSSLSLSFSGQIARSTVKQHDCSFGILKSFSNSGSYKFKSPIGKIQNIECKAAAKQFRIIASITSTIVLILCFILFCSMCKSHSEKLSAGIPAV